MESDPNNEGNVRPKNPSLLSLSLGDPAPLHDLSSSPPMSSGSGEEEEEENEDSPSSQYDDNDGTAEAEGEDNYDDDQNPSADTDETPPNTVNDEEEEDGDAFPTDDSGWKDEERFQNPDYEDEDDFYGISISQSSGQPTNLPKMRSRFSMSHQQILDLNDPFNQKTFEDNISRLNHLLENTQKEYCLSHYNLPNPEDNDFRLSTQLLAKLAYKDELDLGGNFLQNNVGRRLNDGDMTDLVEFLTMDQDIARINLAYNNFGDEAASALSNLLLARPDIYHVNLAHNDFSSTACAQFFETLMQRSPLHSLKLSGIKIGDEGFQWLICLVMSGRGPYDLDISETDITMANFQGLCTAWQTLDSDEEFPKFLVDHPLPIPLEALAEMKAANNEEKRRQFDLIQRRSLVELIRKDAGDMTTETRMEKIPEFPKEYDAQLSNNQSQSRLLEKVSASILQGLFEIPEFNKLKETIPPPLESTLERGQGKIDRIIEKTSRFPQDADEVIVEFKKIRDAGCVPFEPDGRPVIVCPSLYSLTVEDYLEVDPLNPGHFIPTPLEQLVEEAQELGRTEIKSGRAPDDDTANRAADTVMKRIVAEAATFSSTSEYGEKGDATQILLASVLSTCQRAIELQNTEDGEFREEDLEEIWDVATKETVNLLYNRIPPERCSLTPMEVTTFVRKFMESSNRTLLRLLQNPFIPPFIFNAGTLMCRNIADDDNAAKFALDAAGNSCCAEGNNSFSAEGAPQFWDSGNNHVQKIVMSFLEGAVTAAATIIGGGDPFFFRSNEKERGGPLKDALERSKIDAEAAEERVGGVVKDFILAGAVLSVDADDLNKKLDLALDTTIDPAVEFLEETFDQVANLIIEMERRRKDLFEEKDVPFIKYPFASRPNRLVVNRPLFQDYETIAAAKMGDFLKMNTSVKCLHMRKWDLGEDGMINLMDGLSANSNIVLLDLGCNGIGSEGIKGLVKFIQQNPNLKHLLLNNNRLLNPGLKYLSAALPGSNVEFLNISYNGIGEALEAFLEILPNTRIRSLYVLGNNFNQASWLKLKYLFDTAWLLPEYCDVLLQDVDGCGMVVKNSQIRDMNEWYDVQPIVPMGLYRAPYFEDTSHIGIQT